MFRSDSIANLAAALCKAQGEMGKAPKDSSNPFFKSSYADLATCWETVAPVLTKHGLSVSQVCDYGGDGGVIVETILLHESGEFLGGRLHMTPTKADPQGIGSAITYARRYALMAITGLVAEEDDDGNAASGRMPKPAKAEPKKISPVDKARALFSEYKKLGADDAAILARWKAITDKDPKRFNEADIDLIEEDLAKYSQTIEAQAGRVAKIGNGQVLALKVEEAS